MTFLRTLRSNIGKGGLAAVTANWTSSDMQDCESIAQRSEWVYAELHDDRFLYEFPDAKTVRLYYHICSLS